MLSSLLSSVGGFLGGKLGGGILSTVGRYAGRLLGNYLMEDDESDDNENFYYKQPKNNLLVISNTYGSYIPLIFGKAKVYGNIIWSLPIHEKEVENINQKGDHIISYEYSVTFAVAICQGPINEIAQIWANEKHLIHSNYRIYKGTETQLPDPLIQEHEENTPAFRGLAYIVFENMPLDEFNNKIPQLSFEVIRKIEDNSVLNTEDMIDSVVIIPGCGEFVYDTKIQYKEYSSCENVIHQDYINWNNHTKLANSIHNLNQLQLNCKNLKWVAVTVSWFGDSLDIKDCNVFPAVEYPENNSIAMSEDWNVAGFNRRNGRVISYDDGHPRYGGTVNDQSLIRYLTELKKRGFKIMLYPILLMDVEKKPWRGHLTGSSNEIHSFFNKDTGYNRFIIHYANLTDGLIDAFIIGSELIGLTSIKNRDNSFSAVNELINLASQVKSIINVPISYAADWSEYHHTEGGWYNLDDLWASNYIDFIGIDAYFPLTNNIEHIDEDSITKGWQQGEGFDYVYVNQKKEKIAPEYAWKNIKYWWENYHVNPDKQQTKWIPKMKKIWFTEFGFPSIDKATNQPNVFFDPLCSDGGIPKNSTGNVDHLIQIKAIKATIKYWKQFDVVENMFLWAWDARPYPSWPHLNIWKDSHLWEKGHWINNKLCAIPVKSLIIELAKVAKIDRDFIEIIDIDDLIYGISLVNQGKIMDIIQLLRCLYIFDITYNKGKILFIKRGRLNPKYSFNAHEIFIPNNEGLFFNSFVSDNNFKLSIKFIGYNYKPNYYRSTNDADMITTLNLPILLSVSELQNISNIITQHSRKESHIIYFVIPIKYIDLKPSDIVIIQYQDKQYQVRIINIRIKELTMEIISVIQSSKLYFTDDKSYLYYISQDKNDKYIEFINLPPLPWLNEEQNYLHVISNGYREIIIEDNLYDIAQDSIIGDIVKYEHSKYANHYIIDNISTITIRSNHEFPSISHRQFLEGYTFCLINNEIIRYRFCYKIDKNMYLLKGFIRGECLTDITNHNTGQSTKVIFLSKNILNIPVINIIDKEKVKCIIDNEEKMINISN